MTSLIVPLPEATVLRAVLYLNLHRTERGVHLAKVSERQTKVTVAHADDLWQIAFTCGVMDLDQANIANRYYKEDYYDYESNTTKR